MYSIWRFLRLFYVAKYVAVYKGSVFQPLSRLLAYYIG